MHEGATFERHGPPLVEFTINLWSLDPDTCEEQIGVRWSERQEAQAVDLYRLLRDVLDRHVERIERHQRGS